MLTISLFLSYSGSRESSRCLHMRHGDGKSNSTSCPYSCESNKRQTWRLRSCRETPAEGSSVPVTDKLLRSDLTSRDPSCDIYIRAEIRVAYRSREFRNPVGANACPKIAIAFLGQAFESRGYSSHPGWVKELSRSERKHGDRGRAHDRKQLR